MNKLVLPNFRLSEFKGIKSRLKYLDLIGRKIRFVFAPHDIGNTCRRKHSHKLVAIFGCNQCTLPSSVNYAMRIFSYYTWGKIFAIWKPTFASNFWGEATAYIYSLFTGRPARSIRNRFIEKYLESGTNLLHGLSKL